KIADLDSLFRDITFARQWATGYLATMPPAPGEREEQTVTRKALWFAGVISYRRAFTSGRGHLVARGSRVKINDQWRDAVFTEYQQDVHQQIWTQMDRTSHTESPNMKVLS